MYLREVIGTGTYKIRILKTNYRPPMHVPFLGGQDSTLYVRSPHPAYPPYRNFIILPGTGTSDLEGPILRFLTRKRKIGPCYPPPIIIKFQGDPTRPGGQLATLAGRG